MEATVIFWIIAVVVFVIVEAAVPGLISIWFALGSVAALICAALKGPLWLQAVWFLVISVVALLLTRPLAKRYVNDKRQPTNADRLIGRTGVVTEDIDNVAATGAVNMEGQVWTARSLSGEPLAVGARVVAREIRGVKLIVEKAI